MFTSETSTEFAKYDRNRYLVSFADTSYLLILPLMLEAR